MNVLFFLSHQPNPRFIKQINYMAKRHEVNVLCFRRAALPDLGANIAKNVSVLSLGEIASSGQYLLRLVTYLKAFGVLWTARRKIAADVVIINNIDVLALELVSRAMFTKRSTVILEISDLLQYVFEGGLGARVSKGLDRLLYGNFVERLIVTSRKYYDDYYATFFRGPSMELENKPLKSMLPARGPVRNDSDKIIVGVVGLIYQAAPVRALFEAVEDMENVEVHIYGRLYETQGSKALVEEACARLPNVKFLGEYDFFQDAARIYGSLDLLYVSYDTAPTMHNNRLALPNKLYEAMYFRVPLVASRLTYLAERVLEAGIGYEIDCGDTGQIRAAIESCRKDRPRFQAAFEALPDDAFFADNDYEMLASFIEASMTDRARGVRYDHRGQD